MGKSNRHSHATPLSAFLKKGDGVKLTAIGRAADKAEKKMRKLIERARMRNLA